MDETTGRLSHLTRAAALTIALLAVSGCTDGTDPAAMTPTTSPSVPIAAPTPDASASIAAALAADEAALPMPSDQIAEWAAASVPQPGEGGAAASFHGWISRTNGPSTSTEYSSLPAGSYEVVLACRGDSALQADFSSTDGTAVASAQCTGGSLTIPLTTPSPGLKMSLTLPEGGTPTVWAASFTATPAT
jgi:hypothetical protein